MGKTVCLEEVIRKLCLRPVMQRCVVKAVTAET